MKTFLEVIFYLALAAFALMTSINLKERDKKYQDQIKELSSNYHHLNQLYLQIRYPEVLPPLKKKKASQKR